MENSSAVHKLLDEIQEEQDKKSPQEKEENLEQFKTKEVSMMDRNERRSRLRFFKKELTKHNLRKPNINIQEMDEKVQEAAIFKVQAWATRYGIIARKILELGGTQKDLKRVV